MNTPPPTQTVELPWAYRLLNSGPVLLISSTDGVRPNVCPVAWCATVAKKPPRFVLTVGTGHHTFANIERSGVLGINLPTAELRDLVMYCGSCSGRDVDKFAQAGIQQHPGQVLPELPLLSECAAWLECRLTEVLASGDHKLLIVEAVAAACRPGVLDGNHHWSVERYPTLHHLGGSAFGVALRRLDGDGGKLG